MASQVYSGTGRTNFTYTNNTGQNVRVVINYLRVDGSGFSPTISISAGNLSLGFAGGNYTIGRNLAFFTYLADDGSSGFSNVLAANNAYAGRTSSGPLAAAQEEVNGFPTELMLSPGQVFTISSSNASFSYNIVVIPEAG